MKAKEIEVLLRVSTTFVCIVGIAEGGREWLVDQQG